MGTAATADGTDLTVPWAGLDAVELATTPTGIYVHVPFCERRCGYCAFNTYVLADPDGVQAQAATDRYVAAAVAELELAATALGGVAPPLTSVFFGGGTPTMLSAGQLGRIVAAVRERFAVAADLEVTVESNPDGLHDGQLAQLRESGVTRVSFGMQSIRRRVLALLDRTHDPERSLAAVAEARLAGFDHVSLDLIYGTPGERPEDWRDTLLAASATEVDHVSAYALGIEDGTKLAARVRRGELPVPDDDEAADRYLVADELLGAAGLEWYEISNWARSPEARCRHNLLYWRNHHWWGIGPGAHSHLGGTRWWNVDPPGQWADALLGDAPLDDAIARTHVGGHERLDAPQRELERVMLGVRLADGLTVADPVVHGPAVDALVADGLVQRAGAGLVLTRRGRLLANQVIDRLVRAG
jgi:putative oxygen-independent coproporphyrinogen III oxidase